MKNQGTMNRTHLARNTEAFFRAMDRRKKLLSAFGPTSPSAINTKLQVL